MFVYVVRSCIRTGVGGAAGCALPQEGVRADDRDISKNLIPRAQIERQRIDISIRPRGTQSPRPRVTGAEVDDEPAQQRPYRDIATEGLVVARAARASGGTHRRVIERAHGSPRHCLDDADVPGGRDRGVTICHDERRSGGGRRAQGLGQLVASTDARSVSEGRWLAVDVEVSEVIPCRHVQALRQHIAQPGADAVGIGALTVLRGEPLERIGTG